MTITTKFKPGDTIYSFGICDGIPTKIVEFFIDSISIGVTTNGISIGYKDRKGNGITEENDIFGNKHEAVEAAIKLYKSNYIKE